MTEQDDGRPALSSFLSLRRRSQPQTVQVHGILHNLLFGYAVFSPKLLFFDYSKCTKLVQKRKQRTIMSLMLLLLSGTQVLWGHRGAFFFCQAPEYFLLKTSIMCPFSVILVLNLNLVHVRICDVDTLCFFYQLKGAVTGHRQAYLCIKAVRRGKKLL